MKTDTRPPICYPGTDRPITCARCGRVFTTHQQMITEHRTSTDSALVCRQEQACKKRVAKAQAQNTDHHAFIEATTHLYHAAHAILTICPDADLWMALQDVEPFLAVEDAIGPSPEAPDFDETYTGFGPMGPPDGAITGNVIPSRYDHAPTCDCAYCRPGEPDEVDYTDDALLTCPNDTTCCPERCPQTGMCVKHCPCSHCDSEPISNIFDMH
jgi:hypothetical protein